MPENNVKVYQKGDIICKEGVYESWMYEIRKGLVSIYKNYGMDTQEKLGTVDSGYIGEMGMIDSLSRSATAVAEEETELHIIDEEEFVSYFKDHPEKLASIMNCMAGRMNEINENFMSACATIRDILAVEGLDKEEAGLLAKAMKKFSSIFQKRNNG